MRRTVVGAAVGLASLVVGLYLFHRAPTLLSGANPSSINVARTAAAVRDSGVLPRQKDGLDFEGQVIDESDRPVEAATVRVWWTDNDEHLLYANSLMTQSDGTFVAKDLKAAHYYVAATKDDLFTTVSEVDLATMSEPAILRLYAGTSIVVRVIDVDTGAAVPQIEVTADAWDNFDNASTGRRSGATDIEGLVRFHGLGAGWQLRVSASSTLYESYEVSTQLEPNPRTNSELVVRVSRGASVSGSVRDRLGCAVADAIVYVDGYHASHFVRTDKQGMWHFDAVAAGPHMFSASAAHHGRTSARMQLDGLHARENLTLVLDEDISRIVLSGIVVDEFGHPIATALVVAQSNEGTLQSYSSDYVESDQNGRFVAYIAPGPTKIFATKDSRASFPTELTAVERSPQIRLEIRRSTIEGTVIDQHGIPLAHATIFGSGKFERPVSDSNGHFALEGEVLGEHELGAIGPALASCTDAFGYDSIGWVKVKTGDHNIKLVVAETHSITGRVQLDGSSVIAFGVSVYKDGSAVGSPTCNKTVHSNEDGYFTVQGLSAGVWTLRFAGLGFETKTVEHVHVDRIEVDLGVVKLDSGQRIRGRVVDMGGAPISEARVDVIRGESPWIMSSLMEAMNGSVSTRTDAAGYFELVGIVPNSSNRLVARHPSFGKSVPLRIDEHTMQVQIALRATGALDGTVDSIEDCSGVRIVSVADPEYVYYVHVDRLHHYIADDLPTGEYTVTPDVSGTISKQVTVTPAHTAHLDFRSPPNAIDLEVQLSISCARLELRTGNGVSVSQPCTETSFLVAPGRYQVCADGSCIWTTVAEFPQTQAVALP